MAFRRTWMRYDRATLEGAWRAIDELHDALISPAEVEEYRRAVRRQQATIEEMLDEHKVAKEVAERLARDRRFGFTVVEKTAAGVLGLVVLASSIVTMVHQLM